MSAQFFNSLSGYTVGIPPIPVIDSNGNLVSNVFTSGNVFANVVYANSYNFANGQPLSIAAAGSNTQVQFNNNGQLGADANFTYITAGEILSVANISVLAYSNLGSVSNVKIAGGNNGYFLQTDGTGNLTWAPASGGGGGNGSPGGSNSQVQFNNDGNFGGFPGFIFNTTTSTLNSPNITANNITGNVITSNSFTGNYLSQSLQSNITSLGNLSSLTVTGNASFVGSGNVSLGSVSNVKIAGGINGYVLTTDGTGNLTWENPGSGQGNPGGSNTTIQYNNNGNFAGSSAFVFNSVSNAVSLSGNLTTKNITSNNQTVYGVINVSENISVSGYYYGDGSYLSNIQANVANYVSQSAQPNITSVGTLLTLSVTGNILTSQYVSAGGFQTSGSANSGSLNVSGISHLSGSLNATGNANFSGPNVNLGSVSNLHIGGGLNGYFLSTDGLGGLSWQAAGGGSGNTNPGGSNTQIQYNNAGNFAGSNYFTFNSNTNTVQVAGTLVANVVQVGSGSYQFGISEVYFANTSSTSTQVIYSIPVSACSGVDFEIIATDSVGQRRQSAKFSSLYYAGVVEYSEYAGLNINGGIGNFQVVYNPGNVLVAPSLDMEVTPATSDPVVYKMLITILAA